MQSVTYGPSAYISPENGEKINAGINLVELRHHSKKFVDTIISGPINVEVREDGNSYQLGMPRHTFTWSTKEAANIRFEVTNAKSNTPGIPIAFMPDDPWWHNRVHIMDDGFLYRAVQMVHTQRGIIPGTQFILEIDCMRKVLKEAQDIFKIYRTKDGQKVEIDFKWSEEEAKFAIKEYEMEGARASVTRGGQIMATPPSFTKYEIIPGKRLQYRKEVKDLIMKYRRGFDHGWTECPEFQGRYKPEIMEMIKTASLEAAAEEVQQDAVPGLTKENLLAVLKNLSPSEKKELLNSDGDKKPKAGRAASSISAAPAAPIGPVGDPVEIVE